MSRRNSYGVDSFSAANSFDEIGDELADERTHDFDQVDDSLEEAVDRYSKPLPPSASNDILSDLDPSDLTDSQKGTYHVLSTTKPREVIDDVTDSTPISMPMPPPPPPRAPPPPPARALGTITSTALSRTEDLTSDDDTVYTDEDSPHHRGIEDTITHDLTNPSVLTSTQVETEEEPTERPRAVSYHNEPDTGGSTFTFARSPFVGITTPSGRYNSQRLSGRNMSEALVSIWDRFWSDDMKKIVRIFRNRFKELLPHIRKFLAHVVAFWGGVTYIRRALTAFMRVMQQDSRVRELLSRLGWASSTTLRVFMSLCAMVLQGSLQFYFLLRDRIIPQLRRVIPKCYYKATSGLINVARRSPWTAALGPFSLTAAIESRKIPDPYLLHNKFGVPQHDTSFDFGTYTADTFASSMFFGRGRRNTNTGNTGNDYDYGDASSVDYKDF